MDNKTIIDLKQTNFKRGIDLQRETYKNAKSENNIFIMCSAIENIKSEIRAKAKHQNLNKEIECIERTLKWFKGLRSKYTVRTRYGIRFKPPKNWKLVSMNNLQSAYEELMVILEELQLL